MNPAGRVPSAVELERQVSAKLTGCKVRSIVQVSASQVGWMSSAVELDHYGDVINAGNKELHVIFLSFTSVLKNDKSIS